MIFSLHGRWKVEYKNVYYPIYIHVKFALQYSLLKKKVWVIWVLIRFIKGHFWVNYMLELQIL
jgi:hypothetical protein